MQSGKDAVRALGAAALILVTGACALPDERPPPSGSVDRAGSGGAGSAGTTSGGAGASAGTGGAGGGLVAGTGGTGGAAGGPAFGLEQRPANPSCRAPDRPSSGGGGGFPRLLSATGCVDPTDPARPSAGGIEYDVNVPLYSDGASKRRWLALPEGSTIELDEHGDFLLPTGSVLVKLFRLGEVPVETRLFVRHEDGEWAGYSYAWREDGSDAELLDATVTRTFAGQEWTYPSRENCLECHTAAAGRSLGLELGQLNREFDYPLRRANQLATFEHIGLFAEELPPAPLAALPPPGGPAGSVAERARAYLHANCSSCHRPGGVSETTLDLRYETALADMRVCDVEPGKGNFGLVGAKLVKPNDAALSILSFRMRTAISGVRMPPLGRTLSDMEGIALVDGWIGELEACP